MGCGMGTRDEGCVVGFALKVCNAHKIRYSRAIWWAVEEISSPDGFFLRTNSFPRVSTRRYVGFDFRHQNINN